MKLITLFLFSIFFTSVTYSQQTATFTVKKKAANDSIYTMPDELPQFRGGETALINFLQINIQYPQMEQDSGIEGKVLVQFVINEKGWIEDSKVIRSVSPGLDAEALRVVQLLPFFLPGKVQGQAVKVRYTLPFVFKLS